MSKQIILSNTIYQLIGKVFTTIATLIITALITRNLGVTTYGEFSIVLSYITPFIIICDFGINAIVSREFSKNKDLSRNKFLSILTLRIALSLILITIGVLILPLTPYSYAIKTSILVGLLLVFTQAVYNACSIIFQVNSTYKYATYSQIISAIFGVGLIYLTIYYNFGLFFIILAYVLSNALMAFVSLLSVKSYLTGSSKLIDLVYWESVLRESYPLGVSLILNTFMLASDRILLSFMASAGDNGIYSLAYKIFEVVLVIPLFFMNSAYPFLVKKYEASKAEFKLTLFKIAKTLFILSLILSVLTVVFGKLVIAFVWGSQMSSSYYPLAILIAGAFTFFLSSPYSWALVVMGKQNRLPIFYGFGLLFNIVANLILIPQYGYMACAYTTVVTELLVLMLVYRESTLR